LAQPVRGRRDRGRSCVKEAGARRHLEVLARLGRSASDCLPLKTPPNGLKAASAAGVPVLITRNEYFRYEDSQRPSRL
jgi:hypothetical protein